MATMWDLIIKNDGVSAVEIVDLGITVDATSQVDFAELFTYDEIAGSDNLRDEVSAGNLVVNDGTQDLIAADGVEYLSIVHIYYLKDYLGDNYYTQTELSTSGQSAVHWDNVTNKPDFGAFHWLDPADARILGFFATPPVSPTTGDFYVDTDDDHLYKYNGATWDDLGVAEGNRVINLDSTSEDVYEFTSGSWVVSKTPEEGDAIIVTDDGDGKTAMYTYVNSTEMTWIKIADVDLLGGTLQQAYEKGATISIANSVGPVVYDATSSTTAPVELTELTTAPTSNLASGQLAYIDQKLYAYDSTAGLWLSIERVHYTYGRRGRTRNQYLNFGVGVLPSSKSGFMIPEDAVILNIWGQLSASGTCSIDVYKNDVETAITSLAFAASAQAYNSGVNISLDANDYLQVECNGSSNVNDPVIVMEIAYRK